VDLKHQTTGNIEVRESRVGFADVVIGGLGIRGFKSNIPTVSI
jgi:hypothetical protein